MIMPKFTNQDFDTFHLEGLSNRMTAIQEHIQPKFKTIGIELTDYLAGKLGNEMYLHIAKHARRTVNPPKDTWLAIADNKRGYKKHPHFQVGLFDDRLFIWLAFIYELPEKKKIAQEFLNQIDIFEQLTDDFIISFNHMEKDSIPINELTSQNIQRFRDVKKAELLIGKYIFKENATQLSGHELMDLIKESYDQLIPLYQLGKKAIA
ncbi:YktB family protein [Amphibacillus sp. Q70]|uniref:YktB family protein n=1 Tax=Amphibacillus sp. Q70 TaxID=3453416 RepID=UPI003F83434B